MQYVIACLAALASNEPQDWTWHVPAEGEALRRPQVRAVPLSATVSDDVRVDAPFEGEWQRFGFLRYGDADSRRVAIAVDHLSAERVALYVDTERDLVLDADDRVAEVAPGRFALELESLSTDADGAERRTRRSVEFELGATGTILGCATLGYEEGEVTVGERRVRALRRDGDANGLLADDQDQLWLDLDESGRFDPLSELFLVQPIVNIEGQRFACRADRSGGALLLEPLEGTGRVELAPPPGLEAEAVAEAHVVLVGRDGTSVGVRVAGGEASAVEVPIGEYRVTTVTLRLDDPQGGAVWSYVFNDGRGPDAATWRAIEADGTLRIDPIGTLDFRVHAGDGDRALRPGAYGTLQPRLHTGDGLSVVTCYRGREPGPSYGRGSLNASVEVRDLEGEIVVRANSGFA